MSDILEVAPNNIIIWSLYESIKVFVGLFLELNTTAMKWQQMMDVLDQALWFALCFWLCASL